MNRTFPSLVLAADPEGPRVTGYQRALARHGQPPARSLAYAEVLARPDALDEALDAATGARKVVRLESPGKSASLETALIAFGAAEADAATDVGLAREIAKGELRAPALWYRGFTRLLDRIAGALARRADVCATNDPRDVALAFDKAACACRLAAAGIPVAPFLEPVARYDALREAMRARGWERVFVKLRYGSTASGLVALSARGTRVLARTTVEWVEQDGKPTLYNSRRVRALTNELDVARIVDWLVAEGAHVERWIPKASLDGRAFDLRVVTVAGEPTHAVVRASTGPFTNLQLGGTRVPIERVVEAFGPERWRAIETCGRSVAALFPRTLHLGLDVLVPVGGRSHVVAEVNAFGDLLPNLVDARGESTYDSEVRALVERRFPREGSIECAT